MSGDAPGALGSASASLCQVKNLTTWSAWQVWQSLDQDPDLRPCLLGQLALAYPHHLPGTGPRGLGAMLGRMGCFMARVLGGTERLRGSLLSPWPIQGWV